MAKLTRDQKKEIYKKSKNGESARSLAKIYGVNKEIVHYLISLIDVHGYGVIRDNKNRYYSPKLKEEIINKVLVENQSMRLTAIEYGLPSTGMLSNWIKSYKDNGCVIVEKRRGRTSTMINKKEKGKYNKNYNEMTSDEKVKFLENENLYLEAENEYLKKLKAVVQARKDQQQKKE